MIRLGIMKKKTHSKTCFFCKRILVANTHEIYAQKRDANLEDTLLTPSKVRANFFTRAMLSVFLVHVEEFYSNIKIICIQFVVKPCVQQYRYVSVTNCYKEIVVACSCPIKKLFRNCT